LPDAQEQKAKCHENDTETDICAVVYGAVPAKNCRQPVSRVESPSYGSYDAGETSDFFLQAVSPLFVEHSFFIVCVPLVTFCYFCKYGMSSERRGLPVGASTSFLLFGRKLPRMVGARFSFNGDLMGVVFSTSEQQMSFAFARLSALRTS
jgi:hypothetical protein